MKLRTGLVVVAACVFGIVLLKCYPADESHPPDARTRHAEAPATASSMAVAADDGADQSSSAAYFLPITGGRPRPRAPMDPFFRVPKTRNGLPLENDVFVAESVEEQRWLDRNGYPNSQQLAAYSSASDFTLEQAAAHGDQVAGVELASRQLMQGDPEASGKLMTAGMNGSSFALSKLAAYLMYSKHGNPELGYAVSRVVELRGDWRSGLGRDLFLPHPLTPVQKARAEGKAFQMLDSFRRHSPVQPYIDPRPFAPLSKNEPGSEPPPLRGL
jgi:hypothetical protein